MRERIYISESLLNAKEKQFRNLVFDTYFVHNFEYDFELQIPIYSVTNNLIWKYKKYSKMSTN